MPAIISFSSLSQQCPEGEFVPFLPLLGQSSIVDSNSTEQFFPVIMLFTFSRLISLKNWLESSLTV